MNRRIDDEIGNVFKRHPVLLLLLQHHHLRTELIIGEFADWEKWRDVLFIIMILE
ncbi:hypothetical protein HanRHA438_Chr17g0821191 [Helianthus annuus]|nr:hypothetical protein HanRHA438_Chr17g0821191 [Helianthus annuus]